MNADAVAALRCEFVPANEPWTCRIHHGIRTSLDEPQCDAIRPVKPLTAGQLDNLRRADAEGRVPHSRYIVRGLRAALAAAPLPSEPGKRYQSESGHRLNPRCAELMPTDSFCDCGVNGPDLLAAPLPEPGPIGPVRIRSANCAAGDHDDCLLMVEQDVAELGVTECLCQCHDPLPSDTPADGLDAAYRERNAVVAALIRVGGYPAQVVMAPDTEGWWIVYAETPAGQVSWHVSPEDMDLFSDVPVAFGTHHSPWDGHTTEEKYRRVAALALTQEPRSGADR